MHSSLLDRDPPRTPRGVKKPLVVMAAGFALVVASVGAPAAVAQWSSGGSVYSDDGIEITVDPRVVSTFAILNAIGYDQESKVGAPPLFRPKFSEARVAARNAMGRPGRSVKRIAKVVKQNPMMAEKYAQAASRLGPAPKFLAGDGASKLEKGLSKNLRAWYNEEGGVAVVRSVQSKVGSEQKKLLKPVNSITKQIKGLVRLGDEEDQLLDDSGPSGRVILSLNPLDTHGSMTVVVTPAQTTVVAGPLGKGGASDDLLGAVAFSYAKTLVGTEVAKVAKTPGTIVDGFDKLPKASKDVVKNRTGFAIDLMACAVVKVANAKLPCIGGIAEANGEALKLIQERFGVHSKTKDPFAGAAAAIFAAAPIVAPPPPAVPPVAPPK